MRIATPPVSEALFPSLPKAIAAVNKAAQKPPLAAACLTMRSLSSHSRLASAALTPREFILLAEASVKNMSAARNKIARSHVPRAQRAQLTALFGLRRNKAIHSGCSALRDALVERSSQLQRNRKHAWGQTRPRILFHSNHRTLYSKKFVMPP